MSVHQLLSYYTVVERVLSSCHHRPARCFTWEWLVSPSVKSKARVSQQPRCAQIGGHRAEFLLILSVRYTESLRGRLCKCAALSPGLSPTSTSLLNLMRIGITIAPPPQSVTLETLAQSHHTKNCPRLRIKAPSRIARNASSKTQPHSVSAPEKSARGCVLYYRM